MKTLITLFLTTLSCIMLAQIPNPSFETWAGGDPTGWNTLNYLEAGTVTQSATAHNLSSSAALNSLSFGGTYFGGYLQTGTSSHPYFASPGNPAALNGWYQLNATGGDEFKVQLLAKDASGNIKGSATMDYTATTGAVWKQFSACIGYTGVADSAEILFTLTNSISGNTHNGSYALVDDLSLGSCFTGINGIEEISNNITLESAYPNPANNIFNIIYSIPNTSNVSVALYDFSGRKVMGPLNNINQSPGKYKLPVDIHTLVNGIYTYAITVDGIPYTQKLVVAK
jgi:hypothetical protein